MSSSPTRLVWLDVSRVFAMLLVVYIHFFPNGVFSIPGGLFVTAAVPFYFFWAGYFAANNVTHTKVWRRVSLLFITFITWELLALGYHVWHLQETVDLASILGIGGLFFSPLCYVEAVPYIVTLWFIRDLILLTILTPFIIRYKLLGWIFIALMITYAPLNMLPEIHVTMSMGAICIYMCGCYARSWNIAEKLELIPLRTHTFFFIGLLIPVTLIACKNEFIKGNSFIYSSWDPTIAGSLLGILLITQVGIIIHRLFPTMGVKIGLLAPSMVFVLITHRFLGAFYWHQIKDTWLGYIYAPLIFAVCVLLFKLIKQFTPKLLPYLAYCGTPDFFKK